MTCNCHRTDRNCEKCRSERRAIKDTYGVKATIDEWGWSIDLMKKETHAASKTPKKACSTCRHFTRLGLTAGKFWAIPEELERGYCHRNAPIESDVWPGVGANNVCGEWTSRDPLPRLRVTPCDIMSYEFKAVD